MKILVIMGGFFPGKKYGGPPVSVDNFCSLMDDDDCFIYTKNHDNGDKTPYTMETEKWIDRGNCKIKYVSDSKYNKTGFASVIEEVQPDIIYLQGLFQSCILPCLIIAKQNKVKVVLAPRGELCAGALAIHSYKKYPYIALTRILGLMNNVCFQSTSIEETVAIEKLLGVAKNNIFLLPNIPSIPSKKYKRSEKKRGIARFVFISRIHPKKNLISAIGFFKEVKGKVCFDVYGPIEDEAYWAQCQQEIKELPANIEVKYCGLIPHEQVHYVFSKYDAFIFPTQSENYGHVIAEALSVGTVPIISDQTPWSFKGKNECGWDIPLSSKERFVDAINKVIDFDQAESDCYSENAIKFFEKESRIDDLKKKYKLLFNRRG